MDKAEMIFAKLAGETGRSVGAFFTGGPAGLVGKLTKDDGTPAGKGALAAAGVGAVLGLAGIARQQAAFGKVNPALAVAQILNSAGVMAAGYGIGRLWSKGKRTKSSVAELPTN